MPSCNCTSHKTAGRRYFLLAMAVTLIAVVILTLTGCETTQEMAPIAREQLDASQYSAEQFAAFDAGRDIYLRRCSTCHSIEPIDRYSLNDWQRILPGMSDEARLSSDESRQLADYILTLRKAMPTDG
jgi:uncharacterized membrane protein